jgi:hypothetical protein
MGNTFKKKNIQKDGALSVEVQDLHQEQDATVASENSHLTNLDDFDDFNLKSEYWERDIQVPETHDKGSVHTSVKVYTDDDVKEIDPLKIKDIIRNTKGIKQVIVEKVSLDEATRISLLFQPKGVENNLLIEDQLPGILNSDVSDDQISKIECKNFGIQELEKYINSPFLELDLNNKKENGVLKINLNSYDEKTENKESAPKKKRSVKSPKESAQKEEAVRPKKKEENSAETSKQIGVSFKLKKDGNEVNKKLSYSKHTLSRKKGQTHNGHYYRAKDHMELFKVGSSFLKDFKSGLKNFSVIGHEMNEEREKTVFGLASYFNYHTEETDVAIITSEFQNSFYSNFLGDLEQRDRAVFDEDLTYKFFIGRGFELIEFSELRKVERKLKNYDFEYFLDDLSDRFDIVLWDIPDIDTLDKNKELFFPIIRTLDNVSIVVKENHSKIGNINEIINYFKRYQVKIKGLLFAKSSNKKEVAA